MSKDLSSILKYYGDQVNNNNQNGKDLSNNNPDQSNVNPSVNSNLNQQTYNKSKSDFSHLFILMRKATKLFSSFDNKVKLFTDKLHTEK